MSIETNPISLVGFKLVRHLALRLAQANRRLNEHLKRHPGIDVSPCELFSTTELRELLREMLPRVSPALRAIYDPIADGRRVVYDTVADLEADWAELSLGSPRAADRDIWVRDGHCHEVVLWYVHHLDSVEQARVRAAFTLPLLPVADHRAATDDSGDAVGRFYNSKVTCQDCHIGGMGPAAPSDPLPPAPRTATDRVRRCDTNYDELFGIACGPCDGIDGVAVGDDDRYFEPTECEVVAFPSEVPATDRVAAVFPEAFMVEVIGSSDHFGGRTTSSPRLYSRSHGKLYADVRSNQSVWLLRHDTVFTSIVENGVPVQFQPGAHTTAIHSQTQQQRAAGVPGPQVPPANPFHTECKD